MKWQDFFTSSIGKKIIMALTGLFLCAFLIIHIAGNLQIFKKDHGLSFNTYTVFMTSNPLIIFISYTLYITIIIHSFAGLYLEFKNRKSRPKDYFVQKYSSPWYSRSMASLGTIIFIYLVIHMGNFWYQYKFGAIPYTRYTVDQESGKVISAQRMPLSFRPKTKMQEYYNSRNEKIITVKDMSIVVIERFKEWWLVIIYITGIVALSFHLCHGFQSAFRSLGIYRNRYLKIIRFAGIGIFGLLIPALFIIIPVYYYMRSILD